MDGSEESPFGPEATERMEYQSEPKWTLNEGSDSGMIFGA